MLNRVRLRNTSSSQRRVAPSAVALFEIGNRFAVADEHHCPNPPPDIPGLIAGAISEERIERVGDAALRASGRERITVTMRSLRSTRTDMGDSSGIESEIWPTG
jgi:hypothetical protein